MKLDPVFSDNAVFAADKPIRVFGDGCGDFTVSFLGEKRSVKACGRWCVEFPPQKAGGPYEMTIKSCGEEITLKNIHIGRVYLLIGQSNAEFRLCQSKTDVSEYADDPLLRGFFVKRPWIDVDVLEEVWAEAEADKVGDWSALGYLAGKLVRAKYAEPVGVISCFQGASIIESWLPEKKAEKFALPVEQLHIDHTYPEFTAWNKNGVIYKKMLSPLFPYSLSGVIWYQGESDTTVAEAKIYKDELECLIDTVRKEDKDGKLPFVIVQIADFDLRRDDGWYGVQAAQAKAAAEIPDCALAVCRDVCGSNEIHPPTKSKLAERIADNL